LEKAVADRRSFIINFIYFGIIIGLYYFVVKYAFRYLFPFIFAATLAVLLQPAVRFIGKKLKLKAHGFISMILSFMLFFHNISSVGMYTEIYERIFYALEYCLSPILMAIVTLIFSLVSKKNCYSSVGIALSVLSFFFIITEIIVVVIY
jgi:hypothetical protein